MDLSTEQIMDATRSAAEDRLRMALRDRPGSTMHDLAWQASIPVLHCASLLTQLEVAGDVARTCHPSDRSPRWTLTDR